MANITHTNIASNAWAFYAEDVMVRVEAMQAEEERQMRENLGNAEHYSIEDLQHIIATHEGAPQQHIVRRANIARVVLAERLAQVDETMRKLVDLYVTWVGGTDQELVDLALQNITKYTAALLTDSDKLAKAHRLDQLSHTASYLARHSYDAKVQVEYGRVIVLDPVRANGQVVAHNHVSMRTLHQAVRFVEERS